MQVWQGVAPLYEPRELADILFTEKYPFEHAQKILTEAGITDPAKAEKNLQLLAGRGAGYEAFCAILPSIMQTLQNVADPDAALNSWERLIGALRDRKSHYEYLGKNPHKIAILLGIMGTSQYLADILIRRPHLFYETLGDDTWEEAIDMESLKAAVSSALNDASDLDAQVAALRDFKQRQMLCIGARDICNRTNLEQTLNETTMLADVCVQTAFEIAAAGVRRRFGKAMETVDGETREASAVVLALGKLGGRELNYSSDIDLMFIYSHDGETRADDNGAGKTESINNQQYFSKLAERCIDILTRITDQGHLFRVDMRLRPMGSKGPLTSSLNSHLDYYEFYGEAWERQALLKARPIAGDFELAARFAKELRPFVYPKYLDYKGIREIQDIKRRIERGVEREGLTQSEVKLGLGGIRDIEFTVQFLQLLNGGKHPELRTTNTLEALNALKKLEYISTTEFIMLNDAYRFLRIVENRLQIMQNRQLHVLPSNPEGVEVLARGLGLGGSDRRSARETFEREYALHTGNVRRLFDKFFGKVFDGAERTSPIVDLILNPEPTEDEIERTLSYYGFKNFTSAYGNLRLLAWGSAVSSHPSRARDSFCSISPILFQHLARSPDPDMALNNLQRCIAALGAPSAFYEILSGNTKCIELLVTLSSYSDHLIRLLINDPGVIDFLLSTRMLEEESSYALIDKALTKFLNINPDFYESIQRFKNGEILRISLRNILGLATIAEVTHELSSVAEVMLARVYNHCLEEHIIRYGQPVGVDGSASTMSILGMGKLGGHEMNYASDLDVVFVYSSDGQTTGGTSQPIPCQQFFITLAATVMKKISELNPHGYLYKMDARLRPDGEQGILAVSLDSFLDYHRRKSAIWEKRAMTKLRGVAGDAALGRQLENFTTQLIYSPNFFSSSVVEDAVIMLKKIIENAENETHKGKGIKNAEGGIIEIEFLVQLLQLKHGPRIEKLRSTNTMHALEALGSEGIIPRKTNDDLTAALVFFRRVENRLRLMHNRSLNELPADRDALDKLALRLGMTSAAHQRPGEILMDTIEAYIARAHRVFEKQIEELRNN